MEIKIPSTGKPCTKCEERDGNPLHNGVCNVCYSNALFGEPKTETVNILEGKSEDNTTAQSKFSKPKPDIWEERALWIFVGIFIIIGILFLSKMSSNETRDQDYCDGSRNAYCP